MEAVAFLEPHPAGMDDFCHSFAHSGQGGEGGDQVGHIFRVHGDAVEAAFFCQKAAFLLFYMTAHIFQKGDNGPVSLKGGVRQAGKGYGAAGKGGGEPECGLGVVTFYSEGAGFIVLPSRDFIQALFFFTDGDAVARKGVQGHIHVAFGLQRRGASKGGVFICQRQGEEKACKELRAHISGELIGAARKGALHFQRKAAFGMVGNLFPVKHIIVGRQGPLRQPSAAGVHHMISRGKTQGNEEAEGGARFAGIGMK